MTWFSQENQHVRGARLSQPWQLCDWRLWSKGLRIGPVQIPRAREFEHFLILGDQGSGKTSLLRAFIQQIERRNQPAIIIDPESEFVQEFYRPERGDFILNPCDERSPYWSPWLEFRKDRLHADIHMLCASLVRGKAHTPQQMYWQTLTKRFLFQAFQTATNINDLFRLIDAEKTNARDGAYNAVWAFSELPPRTECQREWNALQWEPKREGWLFLTSAEDNRDAIHALQGIWLNLLITRMMTAEIGHAQTWVIGDELATMGYQPKFADALVPRGRKRGISTVMCLQNIAQLRAIYGHDAAVTLASQPATKVFLKTEEPEASEWASKTIGDHEIEGNKYPTRLVLGSEIQSLPKFTGFIISGSKRAAIKTDRQFRIERHKDFIPRQPIGEVATEPPKSRLTEAEKNIKWRGVWERCNNENHVSYKGYGAKGIKLKFANKEALFAPAPWGIGDPPEDMIDPSIERKDPYGHYEPGNVYWIPREEQQRNRRLQLKSKSRALI